MPRDRLAYLTYILNAGADITAFTAGMSQEDYLDSALVRAGVERKFEIIGEALNQLVQFHPEMLGRIEEERAIVGLRHRVIHGYFAVDDLVLWSSTKVDLPVLMEQVRLLIAEVQP